MKYVIVYLDKSVQILDKVTRVCLNDHTHFAFVIGKSKVFILRENVESFFPEAIGPKPASEIQTKKTETRKQHNDRVLKVLKFKD